MTLAHVDVPDAFPIDPDRHDAASARGAHSFLAMYYAGISSNIMSLAGIAIAIGVLVDAGIVVTENAYRYVEQRGVDTRDRPPCGEAVLDSTRLVGRPVFFSMAIILLAFIPVFALTGQEGKLFHPLAFTKTFAVLAATVIAITLVPVLCTLLLRGQLHDEDANPVMRVLRRALPAVARVGAGSPRRHDRLAAVLFAGALFVGTRIGSEFMPPLNEGDLLFMPVADPSISLEENTDIASRQNAALHDVPRGRYAVAKVARADTSTDPSPLNMTETIVHLKPRDQWRPGMTLDRLRAEMSRAVRTAWRHQHLDDADHQSDRHADDRHPIRSRREDLRRGAARTRGRPRGAWRTFCARVPGAATCIPEQLTSGQYLNITIDRAAAARYGLGVGDVQQVIETAIGERNLTTDHRGTPAFSRARALRAGVPRGSAGARRRARRDAGGAADSARAGGATSSRRAGPAMISSENGLLLATVLMNVQGRDLGGFVNDAKAAVASRGRAAAGILHRLERPLGKPGARAPAAADRLPVVSSSSSCSCTSHTTPRSKPRTYCWRSPLRSPAACTCSGCSATTSPSPCGSASSRSSGLRCKRAS